MGQAAPAFSALWYLRDGKRQIAPIPTRCQTDRRMARRGGSATLLITDKTEFFTIAPLPHYSVAKATQP
jgi:hypothetical protein